ncbi:hypothetical protein SFRURICE_017004 [Spodoptera frugiperda]|nr:hypothetical protein SFRURICE_017004 [Spodoptera frugiperda]
MKKLRDCTPTKTLRIIYLGLCQSVLQYGIAIWGAAAKSTLIEVERAQRAVIKVALRKPFRYPTDLIYKDFELSLRKVPPRVLVWYREGCFTHYATTEAAMLLPQCIYIPIALPLPPQRRICLSIASDRVGIPMFSLSGCVWLVETRWSGFTGHNTHLVSICLFRSVTFRWVAVILWHKIPN